MTFQSGPKVLYYDIELGQALFQFYGYDRKLYSNYLPSSSIVQPKWIICAAWKWIGDNHVSGVSVLNDTDRFKENPKDDYFVVKTLRGVIEQADILVGHNSNNFDWKELKAKLIYHKLPPLPKPRMVDTLKAARECRFMANDMRYLADHLKEGEKGHAANNQAINNAEPNAIKEELRYCMQDIRTGVKLYERLKPYMDTHPNVAPMMDGTHHPVCAKCGSGNVIKSGYAYTQAGKYQRYQCKDCGAWSKGKKNQTRVDLR